MPIHKLAKNAQKECFRSRYFEARSDKIPVNILLANPVIDKMAT
jgi:hypothetical protein